jgi:hypothetical protein
MMVRKAASTSALLGAIVSGHLESAVPLNALTFKFMIDSLLKG